MMLDDGTVQFIYLLAENTTASFDEFVNDLFVGALFMELGSFETEFKGVRWSRYRR